MLQQTMPISSIATSEGLNSRIQHLIQKTCGCRNRARSEPAGEMSGVVFEPAQDRVSRKNGRRWPKN